MDKKPCTYSKHLDGYSCLAYHIACSQFCECCMGELAQPTSITCLNPAHNETVACYYLTDSICSPECSCCMVSKEEYTKSEVLNGVKVTVFKGVPIYLDPEHTPYQIAKAQEQRASTENWIVPDWD